MRRSEEERTYFGVDPLEKDSAGTDTILFLTIPCNFFAFDCDYDS